MYVKRTGVALRGEGAWIPVQVGEVVVSFHASELMLCAVAAGEQLRPVLAVRPPALDPATSGS